MKAKLVPLYFKSGPNEDFNNQIGNLAKLLCDVAEIAEPIALGSAVPAADAVVFPQILGDAYNQVEDIKKLDIPILGITSEFATVSMWDWEIASFLRPEGVELICPYNLDQAKKICKSLAVKRQMKDTKFLVFQDNPGEGFQPNIFKCFFWWLEQCTELSKKKFGVTVITKSYKEFGARAQKISDERARQVWKNWDLNTEGVSEKSLYSALKIYIAAKEELEKDPSIRGIGTNCLNESHFSDTTPCLAWNMLFEEMGILWACEPDTMSLLTKYLMHHCLGAPVMMTNIYPSLIGMAALKHERIKAFPKVEDPDNCALLAHCGYFGIVPSSQATEWTLRPKVLRIVNDNATAIDARLPVGPATMVKLGPTLNDMMVIPCKLEKYVQFPDSDCLNGAIVRVRDGHKLMNRLPSHHLILCSGEWGNDIELMAKVFELEIEEV